MVFDKYADVRLPVFTCNFSDNLDNYNRLRAEIDSRNEFEILGFSDCLLHNEMERWSTLIEFVHHAITCEQDFFLICIDCHEFTNNYNKTNLIQNILASASDGTKLLLGGLNTYNHAVILDSNRCWIDSFDSSQFIVVYSELFQAILSEPFSDSDVFYMKLAEMTGNKAVIFPFISSHVGAGSYPNDKLPINHYKQLVNSYSRLERMYSVRSQCYYTSSGSASII